ncbi:signal recognition particle-docking protein FtsY [Phycicoccus jejuensis]|uniref:signal recognition particle-docking protein FtsY n=1 Tax=Phycicoccus jejuensis TaxID=367299 RepID=UPI00384BFFBB
MTDSILTYVGIAVAVLVVVGGVVLGLVRGRGGAERDLEAPERADAPGTPGPADADLAPDGAIGTIEHPGEVVEEEPPAPAPAPTPTVPTVETPEAPAGRLHRLRARLARSNTAIGRGLLALLAGGKLDDAAWEEVEDTLLAADLGVAATTELVDALRTRVAVEGVADEAAVRRLLREELLALVDPSMDRSLADERVGDRPACILVVGVNGTGKTTTVGKLARVLVAEDKDVVLGAADTFRAAAADQLETWGGRVGVPTVRSDRDGADPASVAFDAVRAAAELEADVVIVDTAGRLQNKTGLMDELGKVKRVIEKQSPVDEVLLVLDATTGQNGMKQAEVFAQVVGITGIVLTKLDGTAKGGIVVAVQRALGVPVKLVGLGEGPDDLAPFDAEAFVDAIID